MERLSINSQWKFFIRHCAQYAKQGIIDKIDDSIDVCLTQCNWIFLNGFFLSFPITDEHDLYRRLENIKMYVKSKQETLPWMFYIEPESIPIDMRERLQEICSAAEFIHVSKVKCMQMTQLLPPIRPLPVVEIKFAASEQDAYDAVLLNLEAHKMDTSLAENVIQHRAFGNNFDKEFCCIILVDGKPVSTATTVLLDKCLYVALVATSAEYRQHGYAEVALRASIERALKMFPCTEQGIVLHATQMGQPVYKRLGFKEIADLDMYIHKSCTSTSDH